ncbi:MAG: hypothetical protein CMH57_02170 [Myxococcales bacterium]|nr:hypothetical protein [Myxococcales bacterium]
MCEGAMTWRWAGLAWVALAWGAVTGCAGAQQAPLLVDWSVEGSHPYVLASGETEPVIHVDVKTALPEDELRRIPLNVSLVLDHSGSMSGEQMDDARDAALYMLSQLKNEDRVSVIAFSTRSEVLQAQDEWDDVERAELRAKLMALEPRGTTAMQQALHQALQQVRSRYEEGSINRIILLSDGIPNDASQIMSLANNARSSGISITTMGLGPYYNEDLMAQIADTSGGNYRFIQTSDAIEDFFREEKASMEQVVARNVQVEFNLGPGVEVVQTLGGQAQVSGRQVRFFLGEVGPSDERQLGLRLRVKASASGSRVELLDARLSWEDVIYWSGPQERWSYLEANATLDEALIQGSRNVELAERVGRLQAALEMERAVKDFEEGKPAEAQERLKKAAEHYTQQRMEVQPYAAPASVGSVAISADEEGLDGYIQGVAEELFDADPESDKTKVLLKSVKQRSRQEAGM